MFTQIYNTSAKAYIAIEDVKHYLSALMQRLERGDADSSGSTLRTVGIVVLVLLVVVLLGAAVMAAAGGAANSITNGAKDLNDAFQVP